MVGVAIGFASTTASPAVAKTERERNAKAFPSKGDRGKSYAIDRPFRSDFESRVLSFFLILFEAGRIENEMKKYGKSSKPFFWAARPTEVLKAFEAYTSLLHDLKKGSLL
ncbi:hypothetical protein VNO80_33891 [Phaseolus coccineus]|uniref:Uncharacterized protein n=1 Tax=Phaseolus coccineus TaxID=3886 RepID=A0AAN9KY86_PHACN